MRTMTIEKEVFSYDELSDEAKEAVRQWSNQANWDDGFAQESMQMIADGILEEAGFSEAVSLEYSLYTQGGFPKFSTSGSLWIKGSKYEIEVAKVDSWNSYMNVTVYTERGYETTNPNVLVAVDEKLNALQSKIFYAMRAEDEYMASDEVVKETCEANEWEFDILGRLA